MVHLYYLAIRQLKRQYPHYHTYLTSCKECGIYFFTDPRNKGRKDLRCPFGCSECYSKHQSNIRSKKYYQSPEGKVKKRALNRKRKGACCKQSDSELLQQSAQPLANNSVKNDAALISYLKNLIGLLEHRRVSHEEVVALINDVRQRGIERHGFYPYIGKKENRQPP